MTRGLKNRQLTRMPLVLAFTLIELLVVISIIAVLI
jgi:prepilin-type N-terminal cleavage/methylation domain-containing protein